MAACYTETEQYVVFKYRLTNLDKLAGGDGHQRDLAGRSSGLRADARGGLVHGGYGEAKRFFLLVKTGSSRSGSPRRHGWPYVPFPQQQAPRTARVNTPRLAHNATPLSFSLFDEARREFGARCIGALVVWVLIYTRNGVPIEAAQPRSQQPR